MFKNANVSKIEKYGAIDVRVRYHVVFQLAAFSGEARSSGGPFSRGGADSWKKKNLVTCEILERFSKHDATSKTT